MRILWSVCCIYAYCYPEETFKYYGNLIWDFFPPFVLFVPVFFYVLVALLLSCPGKGERNTSLRMLTWTEIVFALAVKIQSGLSVYGGGGAKIILPQCMCEDFLCPAKQVWL